MGPPTIIDRIKEVVAGISWKVFLWSISMTEDKYLDSIYEQEKNHRELSRGSR